MENNIKTFSLFIKPNDVKSQEVASLIRKHNSCFLHPLVETENGNLIIAIGGDGTFLHAVNQTNFSKTKLYAGVHTGTLGFLQDLSENDVYTLFE